jgi:hypothetical protein
VYNDRVESRNRSDFSPVFLNYLAKYGHRVDSPPKKLVRVDKKFQVLRDELAETHIRVPSRDNRTAMEAADDAIYFPICIGILRSVLDICEAGYLIHSDSKFNTSEVGQDFASETLHGYYYMAEKLVNALALNLIEPKLRKKITRRIKRLHATT